MKTLRLLLAAACFTAAASATPVELDGEISWNITEPHSTFTIKGDLRNIKANGSSGMFKLVVWATPEPYPSPGRALAEYPLGILRAGQSFSDLTVRAKSHIPDNLSGTFYLTISVREETTENDSGWADRLILPPSGPRTILNGDFVDQEKWEPRGGAIVAPPKELKYGDELVLSPKASVLLNLLPEEQREPARIFIGVKNRVKITENDQTNPAKSTYRFKSGTLGESTGKTLRLQLDHDLPANQSNAMSSNYIFYFQGKRGGTYKCTREDEFGRVVTWGSFKYAPRGKSSPFVFPWE